MTLTYLLKKEQNLEWFKDLVKELKTGIFEDNLVKFYQHFSGDSLSINGWGRIIENQKYFIWVFENQKGELLEFKFDKDYYIKTFKDYLKVVLKSK